MLQNILTCNQQLHIIKSRMQHTVAEEVNKLRNRLIELRGTNTLQKVASDLEITHQMLSAIEQGKRDPSMKLARKICSYYKVEDDDSLFFELICNRSLQMVVNQSLECIMQSD